VLAKMCHSKTRFSVAPVLLSKVARKTALLSSKKIEQILVSE
jgi:hypothetical protein